MKKTIIYIMSVCVFLCGCGEDMLSEDSEVNKTENIQTNSSESEETVQYTTEGTSNSMALTEDNTEHIETKEEYNEKMKGIYFEIKEEINKTGGLKQEILFNGLPWGSSFILSKEEMQKTNGNKNIGLSDGVAYLLSYFLFGNKYNIFDNTVKYTEIAGTSMLNTDNMTVAGYNVSGCTMCFTGILKDGEYIFSDEDSALYAAYYTIKSENSENVKEDLKNKISSIYGDPDKIRNIEPLANAPMTIEYIYWYGANDTVLVLSSNESGIITISYAWLGGEELLNAALDNAEKEQSESENEIYGNGDTSGL